VPLVAPDLDTRTFEQILAEVRRRIPTYTPEWTDFNDSDPGMTLAQLFVVMTEQVLFTVNQVPNKGLITFLKMVGVELHPAVPAMADVTFIPVGGTNPAVIPVDARTQVQTSAPPPGQTKPLTFETVSDFTAINGTLVDIVNSGWDQRYTSLKAINDSATGTYLPFNEAATTSDSFYLVLDLNVAAGSPWPLAAFRFRVNVPPAPDAPAGTIDVGDPTNTLPPGSVPRIAWSYSSGTQTVSGTETVIFAPISPTHDSTLELTQSGYLEFTFSDLASLMQRASSDPTLVPANFQGRFVLRAQVLTPDAYGSSPPQLASVLLNTVPARNLVTVRNEALGSSTGQPFQRFVLANAPVYPGSSVLSIYEPALGAPTLWYETPDLFSAGPTDRVYELTADTGEVLFGDGTTGRVPPPDDGSQPTGNVSALSYQYGGGTAGNVGALTLTRVLGAARPVALNAKNVLPAAGGDDEETAAAGVARAPAVVRSRYRAVSAEDFEALAMETPNTRVARANALPNTRRLQVAGTTPGAVTVVLVPHELFANSITVPIGLPPQVEQAVLAYLDSRRLLTTEVYAAPATFRQVTVTASLQLSAGTSASTAHAAALTALNTYFHALVGGEDGNGWPFGGTIYFSRVFQQLLAVTGVTLVQDVTISLDSAPSVTCQDVTINLGELLYSGTHQILVTAAS
jgi:predicted phage baseplate assembly protein